jgi:hypothetical protein
MPTISTYLAFSWNENISALVPLVQAMVNCFGLPHALVIHCGGNDIGMGSIREVLNIELH